jgi:hypothetical protein
MATEHDNHDNLVFLERLALDADAPLSESERQILARVRAALDAADAVVIHIGGKAGRLGEAIVGAAFLEGTLRTLAAAGKTRTPVTAIIDSSVAEIMPQAEYRARYWPEITITEAPPGDVDHRGMADYVSVLARNILTLDFHGEHDGAPALYRAQTPSGHVTTLARLNRVALRSYAARGPEQRYAAFFGDLFQLATGSLNGEKVQPRIYIPATNDARYPQVARAFGFETDALLVVCFFQSVVAAKCYERWDEVLALLADGVGARSPGERIVFFVACGPDTDQPVHQEDVAAILGGFTGSQGNARVVVATTPSLRELAVILRHAQLALANDTGPGHLAGALGVPTITPYLPGALYSQQVWASSRWHHGVAITPNPYSFEALKAEVFAGRTDIINAIPPELLATEALKALCPEP